MNYRPVRVQHGKQAPSPTIRKRSSVHAILHLSVVAGLSAVRSLDARCRAPLRMRSNALNEIVAAALGALVASIIVWLYLRGDSPRSLDSAAALDRAELLLATTRAEAAQLREIFEGVLNAFPGPLFITDHDRRILFTNDAALHFVQLPRAQVLSRVAATVIQDYDTTLLLMEAARTGVTQERTFQRPTTGQTWQVLVTPLHLSSLLASSTSTVGQRDEPTHLVLSIDDLTELRRLETIRQDFVSHVSHELRTPLAAMKLLAETLTSAIERDPPAAQEFAHRVINEIDHLSQMVAELLELSHVESGKTVLQSEPTDIGGLVEVVVDRMRPLAEEHGVTLAISLPSDLPEALADSKRIGEVLVNLIHNGLKYTPPGGSVTISADTIMAEPPSTSDRALVASSAGGESAAASHSADAAQPVEMICVRVSDTGVGISEDDLPRIFERFFKADRARTRVTGSAAWDTRNERDAGSFFQSSAAAGTGLGLAISRHLIELHHGRIWAQSRLGRGSTLSFTLPIATHDQIAAYDARADSDGRDNSLEQRDASRPASSHAASVTR